VPQLHVDHDPLAQAGEALLGDLGAAVQIDLPQVHQAGADLLQGHVGHLNTLADVESLKIKECLGDLAESVVGDLAGGHGEGPKVEEAGGDVDHGAIRYSLAEGQIKGLEPDTTFGEVSHADVTDIVARAEVEAGQGAHSGHRLHAGVRDVRTEAEIEVLDPESLRDVTEREVGQLLAVLEVEAVELSWSRLDIRSGRKSGQVGESPVTELPAGTERQVAESWQCTRQQEESGVSHSGAATQVEVLEIDAVSGDSPQTAISDFLAEREVDGDE
jgi:hypothetical protein